MPLKRNLSLRRSSLLLWSLLWSFSQEVVGQGSVFGTVSNREGDRLPNAGIILTGVTDRTWVKYGYSGPGGQFRFEGLPPAVYTLEVSCMGYEKQSLTVDSKEKDEIHLVLERKTVALNEVIVLPEQPVKIGEDTITVLTDYFTNGTEQNIEELLRKIPGVRVEEDGTIKVGNQEVEKVMVEGDDFFEKGYKLLTQNMAAYPVNKVEIYQNYSRNKHLKGIENSTKVALNLSLREEVKRMWFGNGQLGYGGERYQVKANVMNFGKKSKYYFLTHLNNLGEKVTGEPGAMDGEDDAFVNGSNLPVRMVGSLSIAPPNLKKQRITFNHGGLLSLNSIFALSDKVKVKTLGLLHADRNRSYRSTYSSVAAGGVSFENMESFQGLDTQWRGFGNAELTYDISPSSTLLYTAKVDNTTGRHRNAMEFNAIPVNERLREETYTGEHYLHFTRKIKENKALVLTGNYFQTRTPQEYQLEPFIYRDLFLGNGDKVHQAVTHGLEAMKVEGILMDRKKSGDLWELRWGGQWRKERLTSSYQPGVDGNESLLTNDRVSLSTDFYAAMKYLKKWGRLQWLTQADLHRWSNGRMNTRFFMVPRLGITYDLNKHRRIQSSYTYGSLSPGIQEVYSNYIHTGFRTFSKGTEKFELLNTSTALLNYSMGNWGSRLFLNTFLVYVRDHQFLTTHTALSPDYSVSEKIRASGREAWTMHASADRFFSALKSNLKLTLSGSQADFKNKINGSAFRKVAVANWFYGWENRSAFHSFFNYHLGSKWIYSRVRTETAHSYTDRTSFLDLEFRANRQWHIKAQGERYYFGRSSDVYYFVDLETKYDLPQQRWVLYVSGNNLFNTKVFRNYIVSDIGIAHTEYRLQPRLLLVKAEYRF